MGSALSDCFESMLMLADALGPTNPAPLPSRYR
jgi:hypothetical protein